jgi:hypothetical protein
MTMGFGFDMPPGDAGGCRSSLLGFAIYISKVARLDGVLIFGVWVSSFK